jgi:hypothetical protein
MVKRTGFATLETTVPMFPQHYEATATSSVNIARTGSTSAICSVQAIEVAISDTSFHPQVSGDSPTTLVNCLFHE